MPTTDDVRDCVLKMLAQESRSPLEGLPSADIPLGDDGLAISSLGLVRVFIALEDTLDIQFDDALLSASEFTTAGDVVEVVLKAMRAGS